jgi:hypothetical protein
MNYKLDHINYLYEFSFHFPAFELTTNATVRPYAFLVYILYIILPMNLTDANKMLL